MQESNLLVCVEDAPTPIVRASGELDFASCAEFESVLQRAFDGGRNSVVLHLDELDFVDSCGIRLLIKTALDARKTGRSLHIASITPHLDHVLTLSGFRDLFAVGTQVEAAPAIIRTTNIEDHCFSVPGLPGTCRQVRNEVAEFAREIGFDQTAIDDVKLAVGEAISNAVRHGAVCDSSIDVQCRDHGGVLTVVIRYPSSVFDPDSVPAPTFSSAPEGGMGIHFMKLVMDRVDYEFKDGCTELTIEKRRPQ